jgi:hypothetical protein
MIHVDDASVCHAGSVSPEYWQIVGLFFLFCRPFLPAAHLPYAYGASPRKVFSNGGPNHDREKPVKSDNKTGVM